jgi:hypothetical protein
MISKSKSSLPSCIQYVIYYCVTVSFDIDSGLSKEIMYRKDDYGKDILLMGEQQIMMSWEAPYMEALVSALDVGPEHDVLEIGFGLGFSARAIQQRKPRSHTIIEIDASVISYAKSLDWTSNIIMCQEDWQDVIRHHETTASNMEPIMYDRVFFDDFPLVDTDPLRILHFLDRVLCYHCKPGAKITFYLENSLRKAIASNNTYTYEESEFKAYVASNCRYLSAGPRIMYVPLLTLR